MKLSEKIAELRKEKGWSQEQLAVKLEVSRQAVYKWEADINQPDLDKLKRIARLFDVSYNVLMDDEMELPSINQIVEVEPKTEENEEEPHVEILENVTKDENSKTVHNEVAVQINCAKENPKPANKKLVISLCVFAAIIVVCLCALSYIIFGIVLQKDSYLVKFDTQSQMVISDLVIKDGKSLNNVTTPTKNGYTFDGWYIGDKKWDFDKDKVKGNITLTAKWIANENKITYINYETGEKYEATAKTDETVVLDSNTFKKEGYTFGGWATSPNGDTVYTNCDSFKMGAEPITLYAVWVLDEFTLTLNAGNGVINDTYPQKFTSNDTITLPIPELEYYTFDGWYDENNVKYDTIPKGTVTNLTLSAKYSPIKYKITYVLNGGTNHASNPTEYMVGNKIVLLAPTKDNIDFGGWYYDESFLFEFDSEMSFEFGEDLTLYARWDESYFEFTELGDGFMLTKYEGTSKKVVIPDTYLYGDVVGISANAFEGCIHVEEIVIPSTVYNIELPAFADCTSLTTITVDRYNSEYSSIDGVLFNKSGTWLCRYPASRQDTVYVAPNSVDVIGDYAFAYSIYLEEVYLPNDPTLTYGVGKICQSAFEGCISLTTIELGYIANYFEAGCFSNCWSLESIEFKAETVWGIEARAFEGCLWLKDVIFSCSSVKEIGTNVFTGCVSLTTLDLSVVEKIGAEAFSESGITELYIPLSVSYVGNQLFVNCIYDEIIVYCEAASKPSDWAYNWSYGSYQVIWGADNGDDDNDTQDEAEFTYGLVGNTAVITGCVGSGVVTVPVVIDDYLVKGIEPYAFSGNANITEIIIPSSIPSIDVTAFENCPGLEKIIYVNSGAYTEIRSVDGVLFGDYGRAIIKYPEGKKDKEYVVPTNVDIIRKFAFKNNTHLTKITLPSDIDGDNYVGKIEQGGFEGCSSLEYVYGCAVGYFDKEAFKNCTSLKELTCVNVISFIMNQAFVNCVSLESVTFKKDVGIINWQSFGYCTNLESVAFSCKVETFGWGCFEGCSSLKGIIIPEGATVIGGEAFKLCSSLESVVISSTVTKIEKNAFLDTGLKEIFIPLTVTTIDEFAFMGANDIKISCQALVKPSEWNEKWNYTVVDGEELPLNTIWGVDNNSQAYDGYVLNGDGTLCLNSFTGTGNVTVPSEYDGKTVTSISENAFLGQSSITGIHIPKTITSIDVKAFNGLLGLEAITVDAENTEYTALDGVLYSKSMITLVRYPAAKADKEFPIPYEVEKIGSYSFYGCQYIESVLFLAESANTYDPIDGIMNNAFESCASLKSFTVSKQIDNIGEYAFNNCALFSEFNNEANYLNSIGMRAFSYTALKNFYIPFVAREFGADIFKGCTGLTVDFELNNPYVTWITWDDSWDTDVSVINYGVVSDVEHKKASWIVDEENNVLTLTACVGTGVLYDLCPHYDMDFIIGPYSMCNLKGVKKIVIPSNTVEIDPLAFYNSQIAEFGVTINMNNPDEGNYSVLDGVLYSKDGKTLVRYPSAKADEEFIVPDTVTKIAENAFSGATNLKKVQIKSNVTEIGKNAFSYLSGLTLYCQVDAVPSGWDSAFADGIKGIEWISADATFTISVNGSNVTITGCEGKGAVTVPSVIQGYNVVAIGKNAFSGQSEITEIIIPAGVNAIDATAFENCKSLEKITCVNSSGEFRSADGVLYGDSGRSIVKYPEGKKDSEFTVPYNVDIIRPYAFKNNTHLTKITLPNDVEGDNYVGKLEQGAFYGCTSLTNVENCCVTYIDKEAFRECRSLKEITFYSDISHIMNQAFYNCQSLESVTFKGNVGDTGWQSFCYCTRLKNISFEGTLGSIGWGLFEGCLSLQTFTIPNGVTNITGKAFKNCQSLTSIVIPSTVVSIEKNAFVNTFLAYVNIPSTVTSIEDGAFYGIYDLSIFCEAKEKPTGWGEKWNYQGEKVNVVPYVTYWNEQYIEPTFEYEVQSGGNVHIVEIRNIQSKVLILPAYYKTSKITHLTLTETTLAGVEEILISNWMGLNYDVYTDFHSDLKYIRVATLNQNYKAIDGVLYSYDKTELLHYPKSKEESEYVTIKELKTIRAGAFENAKNLTSIVLYNDSEAYGVEKIEGSAFKDCAKLTDVYFGKSIREIGDSSFSGCSSIKILEFTNSKSLKIGQYAFYECAELESVSISGISTDIGDSAFHLCDNVSVLKLYGANKIGSYAFSCNSLKKVYIPGSVTYIMSNAFDRYENTTFYCGSSKQPTGWRSDWINTNTAEVIWGQETEPIN